jgi:flagellar hook assembly protein FlgD
VENRDIRDVFTNGKEVSVEVYPNPATTGTTVSFILTEPVWVNLEVYDILGRRIRKLASSMMEPGVNAIHWDGKNDKGQDAATGVYFMRMGWRGQSKIARFAVVR